MNLSDRWPFDLVEVQWLDASGDTGWKAHAEVTVEETLVTSIGFLVKKDRKHLILAASVYRDEDEFQLGGRDTIPRGMVKGVRVLVPKNSPVAPDQFDARVAPGGTA